MDKEFFLSDQAVGALMLELQHSLMTQEDITKPLKEWKFKDTDKGLIVLNPRTIKFDEQE